jgi:hypothetical protein
MATRKASTKAAVLEDETTETEVEETTAEPTTKQLINEGIVRVIDATGIDVQKNRYKAMRAIAFQAFQEAIDSGDFDDLVDRAIANVDSLPSGWEIERGEREAPAPKASPKAKAATTKATAKAPAKAAPARKRPAR